MKTKKKKHNLQSTRLKTATAKVRNLVIGSHYNIVEPFYFDMLTKQQIAPAKDYIAILGKFRFRWLTVLALYWEHKDGTIETDLHDIVTCSPCFYHEASAQIRQYQRDVISADPESGHTKNVIGNAILISPVLDELPEEFIKQMLSIMENVDDYLMEQQNGI